MSRTVVIALGGNSFISDEQHQSVPEQYRAAQRACGHVAGLLKEPGLRLVVTHGNGPQVGFILQRSELASKVLHQVPLDSCVADTQGALGYDLARALRNELQRLGVEREPVALVTLVLVDSADPAFKDPSKPVGGFLTREVALAHRVKDGWFVAEDAGRGWRRVVASPAPRAILDLRSVRALLDAGFIVIAAGGGGIPVVVDDRGEITGVPAVVDKDLTSSLLARQLGAELLVISTGVDRVSLEFNTPRQRAIDVMTSREARAWIVEGHFRPGSMLPKVQAAVEFVEATGAEAVITDPEHLEAALAGHAGTRVRP